MSAACAKMTLPQFPFGVDRDKISQSRSFPTKALSPNEIKTQFALLNIERRYFWGNGAPG
jgi:hypothetical protein